MNLDQTILVVDDEAAVRSVIVTMLRGAGYTVIEANDGEDALRAASEHAAPIDLIISDAVMPRMGGIELLSNFRRWYPGVPLLLVSGYPDAAKKLDSTGMQMGFLTKPFSEAELLDVVAAMLG